MAEFMVPNGAYRAPVYRTGFISSPFSWAKILHSRWKFEANARVFCLLIFWATSSVLLICRFLEVLISLSIGPSIYYFSKFLLFFWPTHQLSQHKYNTVRQRKLPFFTFSSSNLTTNFTLSTLNWKSYDCYEVESGWFDVRSFE